MLTVFRNKIQKQNNRLISQSDSILVPLFYQHDEPSRRKKDSFARLLETGFS
ncbi:hypothetical protein HM1_1494 [Heliomicrobium modesticaldum Ice1]|uniref:Uncharacterized protein n=1 Tax=Heliobacterium modesticaldum (strain ATCC 51547 / Ice1) TaxID=498761 RepID=B0TCP1_HELMI|nr:hypothetical protein HM1_1494 [Heliomicrobium modesticaldum Ice1]